MTRSLNRKLSRVIHGRAVADVTRTDDTATIHFGDGSVMTVRMPPQAPALPAPPHGDVVRVRQDDTTLELDLDSGATLTLPLAEATSSVMLRAADHTFEYAD